jgi:ubiquinone/menaquinone biosynthesis C-methylase UbiE
LLIYLFITQVTPIDFNFSGNEKKTSSQVFSPSKMSARGDGLDSDEAPWKKMARAFGNRNAAENAAHLLPCLKHDSKILDVGCGIGSITLDLAALSPQGRVIGIDTNTVTTELAQQMAQDKGVQNVEFRIGNALDLSDYADESFDAVYAHQVMLHLPEPVKALKEMRRVLKTSGVLAIRDNVDLFQFPHDPWIQQNLGELTSLQDPTAH